MTTLALALVVVGGLACPIHMIWRMRRGRSAACCLPQADHHSAELEQLHRQQRALGERLGGATKLSP